MTRLARRFALVMMLLLLPAARPARAQSDDDPYLWLEDVTGERALTWVKARNAESTKALSATPEFDALDKKLRAILDSDDRIPNVRKLGPWYYNFWRDAAHPRGVWRRTTLEEYRKAE